MVVVTVAAFKLRPVGAVRPFFRVAFRLVSVSLCACQPSTCQSGLGIASALVLSTGDKGLASSASGEDPGQVASGTSTTLVLLPVPGPAFLPFRPQWDRWEEEEVVLPSGIPGEG